LKIQGYRKIIQERRRIDMANPTILWGTINADGTIESSSGGFTVTPGDEDGHYAIAFAVPFNTIPSIVGSQIGFGGNENPLDNIVFPKLNNEYAKAITGDAQGNARNRSFSFIAIGT
jgi:hypothetical protein